MTFVDDNGNSIDFDGEFALTKQAVSVIDGSINGDVSINFTLDANSHNKKVLGYNGPNMINQVAFTKQPFNRIKNGNIIDRGFIVIQSEENDELNCFYVSGNSNWVQKISGLITELDFSGVTNGRDYSKRFTRANVTSTQMDGIVYPLVDWIYDGGNATQIYSLSSSFFKDSTNDIRNSPIHEFYPCFSLKTLVSEIAKQNGLKISGNILQDELYNSLIVTPHNGLMKRISNASISAIGSNQSLPANTTGTGATKYTNYTSINDPLGLFSNGTYRAIKNLGLVFTITCISRDDVGIGHIIRIFVNNNLTVTLNPFLDGATFVAVIPEILNSALVNVGDLFDIRIDNPDVVNPHTVRLNLKIDVVENVTPYDIIYPNEFLPPVKSLDIIKLVINYFGCVAYFDEFSQTISINKIDSLKIEDSLNWSNYYISHRSEYTVDSGKNNYLRISKSNDKKIKSYNDTNTIGFGEGNIETDNDLKDSNTVFTLPIQASSSINSKNNYYLTNIPLANLNTNGDPIAFTFILDITGSGSIPAGTFGIRIQVPDSTIFFVNEIISITSSANEFLGYTHIVSINNSANRLDIIFPNNYINDNGYVKRQKITYNEVGFRMLSIIPNINVADFSSQSQFTLLLGTSTQLNINEFSLTQINYATFCKEKINDGLDSYFTNCALDNPNTTSGNFFDPTIKQLYFKRISKFIGNPTIRAQMLLPEAVFQSFKFDQFIYLNTQTLTGYFFVKSIVNYQNGSTPVEVNLYML